MSTAVLAACQARRHEPVSDEGVALRFNSDRLGEARETWLVTRLAERTERVATWAMLLRSSRFGCTDFRQYVWPHIMLDEVVEAV